MMANASCYVLPWGQMSFHGAVVITNLFGALPIVGESITTFMGDGQYTANAEPLLLAALPAALHDRGKS